MPATPGETFLDGYLPYLLRQADQAISAAFYDVLTREGVPRSDWRVLAVLHEYRELSIRELTHHSLSPQPTVTHSVRRLEGRNLVRRVQGTDDKRQRFVSITKGGDLLTATLVAEAKQLEQEALRRANLVDLEQLALGLKQLTIGVTETPHDTTPLPAAPPD
ncbi:MAG: MarR family transcriptional regulator [Actinomycetota bacterium]